MPLRGSKCHCIFLTFASPVLIGGICSHLVLRSYHCDDDDDGGDDDNDVIVETDLLQKPVIRFERNTLVLHVRMTTIYD